MKLRLVYPRIKEAPLTTAEHDRQRRLVELSERRSSRRSERRDETAVQARLYPFPRTRVETAPVNPPEPPNAA